MIISLIIPFYDKDHTYFPKIIKYINRLSFKKEVIFVDDRNDKTEDIRAKYNILDKFKIVNSHVSGENVGTFEARKTGVLNATGDYIWFVDIDDEPLPIDLKIDPNNLKDIYIYNASEYIVDEGVYNNKRKNPFYNLYEMVPYLKTEGNIINISIPSIKKYGKIFSSFLRNFAFYPVYIVWDKLIKRSIVVKAIQRTDFEKGFCNGEDTVLMNLILTSQDSYTFQFNTSKILQYNISIRDKYIYENVTNNISMEKLKHSIVMSNKYMKGSWLDCLYNYDTDQYNKFLKK